MSDLSIRDQVKNAARDYTGVRLTDEQADQILSLDAMRYGIANFGLDTVAREKIASILANRIVGRSWPRYGEAQETKDAFFSAFPKYAAEKGYEYVDEH